jgi:predicted DNA-binding transcriptional regulator AlpA
MLLSTPDVAARLGVAEITLRKWRIEGFGPRFIRCGSNIRYRVADIEKWLDERTVASTSEHTA